MSLLFSGSDDSSDEEQENSFFTREKIQAYIFAFIFSLSLWFVVNLGRDYNITMRVPLQVTNISDDVSLSSEIPDNASVSLSGEGWNLINIYANPPTVFLSAENQQINLFDEIRQQIGSVSDLNVMQVDPIIVSIETEEKLTKKVPVISRVDLTLRGQYGIIGEPSFQPDSVVVTGPGSRINDIESWDTEETELSNVTRNIERNIDLQSSETGGVRVEPSTVIYSVQVAEFTESEVKVPIRTRNLPSGKAITYNPSTVTVRFNVPIDQYNDVQDTRPFFAYVDYAAIETDDTGFITPEIERATDDFDVRMRDFQPSRVSYFNILPQ
ncbi:MAG: YbbR-like domain-containing protein [Balneolaceae bacterium]